MQSIKNQVSYVHQYLQHKVPLNGDHTFTIIDGLLEGTITDGYCYSFGTQFDTSVLLDHMTITCKGAEDTYTAQVWGKMEGALLILFDKKPSPKELSRMEVTAPLYGLLNNLCGFDYSVLSESNVLKHSDISPRFFAANHLFHGNDIEKITSERLIKNVLSVLSTEEVPLLLMKDTLLKFTRNNKSVLVVGENETLEDLFMTLKSDRKFSKDHNALIMGTFNDDLLKEGHDYSSAFQKKESHLREEELASMVSSKITSGKFTLCFTLSAQEEDLKQKEEEKKQLTLSLDKLLHQIEIEKMRLHSFSERVQRLKDSMQEEEAPRGFFARLFYTPTNQNEETELEIRSTYSKMRDVQEALVSLQGKLQQKEKELLAKEAQIQSIHKDIAGTLYQMGIKELTPSIFDGWLSDQKNHQDRLDKNRQDRQNLKPDFFNQHKLYFATPWDLVSEPRLLERGFDSIFVVNAEKIPFYFVAHLLPHVSLSMFLVGNGSGGDFPMVGTEPLLSQNIFDAIGENLPKPPSQLKEAK